MKTSNGNTPPGEPTSIPGLLGDTIASNRALAIIPASAIPVPPEGFRSTDAITRARVLRKVNAEHVAEGKEALAQLVTRGTNLTGDFGKNAPKAPQIATLLERIQAVETSLARVNALRVALEEQQDIALSDMAHICDRVLALYNSNIDADPALAEHYTKVVHFATLHGTTIAEALARRREAQQQLEEARKQGKATGTDGNK